MKGKVYRDYDGHVIIHIDKEEERHFNIPKCTLIEPNRLRILLLNLITSLNEEILQYTSTTEEKLEFLKEKIGITDEEIKALNIVEECL